MPRGGSAHHPPLPKQAGLITSGLNAASGSDAGLGTRWRLFRLTEDP